MLKILVAAFALLAVSPVAAEEVGVKTVERWWDAHYVCRMGEQRDGGEVSEQAHDTACQQRESLTHVLEKAHYCWSEYEQEWYPIGHDNGFCQKSD